MRFGVSVPLEAGCGCIQARTVTVVDPSWWSMAWLIFLKQCARRQEYSCLVQLSLFFSQRSEFDEAKSMCQCVWLPFQVIGRDYYRITHVCLTCVRRLQSTAALGKAEITPVSHLSLLEEQSKHIEILDETNIQKQISLAKHIRKP